VACFVPDDLITGKHPIAAQQSFVGSEFHSTVISCRPFGAKKHKKEKNIFVASIPGVSPPATLLLPLRGKRQRQRQPAKHGGKQRPPWHPMIPFL
jgi:hypothetical protein